MQLILFPILKNEIIENKVHFAILAYNNAHHNSTGLESIEVINERR